MTSASNTSRIAKNTLYMYFRMLVTIVVSLYTTRINFQALGIDDFGIYNIVGSIIVFFAFINNGLTTATRRYITAELAQGDDESQQNVFNLAVWAHVLIAAIIILLGETIGLWAVNNLLNVPADRMMAANVVYQLSIFTAVLNIMQVPFTAAITANERMSIYAYISIFDILAKLAVAYGVMLIVGDKLIIYGALLTIASTIVVLINRIYCYRVFPMCRYKRPHNRQLLKEVFTYMGWSLMGQGAVVLTNQGVSVLVNAFFNVAANAAMGISNQITSVVSQFVSNFQVAFNPQITKLYVSKNNEDLVSLANRCSRFSMYLVLILIIPICFQVDNFLSLWLGNYPKYGVEFCVITLIAILIDSMSAPLWMILSADKNITKYQIVISSIYAINFIGSWIVLKLGFLPYSVIIVRVGVYCIAIGARLMLVKEKVPSFKIIKWLRECPLRTLPIIVFSVVCCFIINIWNIECQLSELIIKGILAFGVTCLSVLFMGFTKAERGFIIEKVLNRIK